MLGLLYKSTFVHIFARDDYLGGKQSNQQKHFLWVSFNFRIACYLVHVVGPNQEQEVKCLKPGYLSMFRARLTVIIPLLGYKVLRSGVAYLEELRK